MDGGTNGGTENLPILQDFVSYRGCAQKMGYRRTHRPSHQPTDRWRDTPSYRVTYLRLKISTSYRPYKGKTNHRADISPFRDASTSHQEASYGQRYPCPALYSFWVEVGLQRGSGPNRGQSLVEWEDFSSVHPSVRLSVCPSIRPLVYLSVYPSFRPSVHPSIRPSVHPSVRPSIRGTKSCRMG